MTHGELNSRIADLKEGDYLDLTQTVSFGTVGLLVERVTEKAILVDGEWIPKSQILAISYGHFYKGIEKSNTNVTEHKQLILSRWWDEQSARRR